MTSVVHAEAVMGTVVTLDLRSEAPGHHTEQAIGRVIDWLDWVDATFSTYRRDSEVNRLDRGELRLADSHRKVRDVLARCEELCVLTDGYFDSWATGHLDPSGFVKGWAIERASQMLTEAGVGCHAINGGGDVRVRGEPAAGEKWRVGITHPFRSDTFCAAVALRDGAVATSGLYERGLHVVDPRQRRPATDLAAATVIGPELAMADAYATTALAMGRRAPDWLADLSDHEALIIDPIGRWWETEGFKSYRVHAAPSHA
jgi:thiamine biosynthesis lipoprotein